MSTITSPDIIVKLLKDQGRFEEGLRAFAVYQYFHVDSKRPHWKIIYDTETRREQMNEFLNSPFVASGAMRLWDKEQGFSIFGLRFMHEQGVPFIVEGQNRANG